MWKQARADSTPIVPIACAAAQLIVFQMRNRQLRFASHLEAVIELRPDSPRLKREYFPADSCYHTRKLRPFLEIVPLQRERYLRGKCFQEMVLLRQQQSPWQPGLHGQNAKHMAAILER